MFSILTYHSLDTTGSVVSVSPQDFSRQMESLAGLGYRGITLGEAVAHRKRTGAWPDKCAALTFDDGYANFYDTAWPTLARHGFNATIFVISDFMGAHNDWAPAPPGLGRRPILSWRQAAELSRAGMEIGSHTRTHPDLRLLSLTEAEQEIVSSRVKIEDQIGRPVKSFAYPFGYLGRASLGCVVKEFHAACTTVLGRARDESLHLLPRIDMFYIRSERNLQPLLDGRLDQYLGLRRAGRAARRSLMALLGRG